MMIFHDVHMLVHHRLTISDLAQLLHTIVLCGLLTFNHLFEIICLSSNTYYINSLHSGYEN